MTNQKNNNKSGLPAGRQGLYITIGIVILAGLIYTVSASFSKPKIDPTNNKSVSDIVSNTNKTTSAPSCGNGGSCGCGGGKSNQTNTSTPTYSCGMNRNVQTTNTTPKTTTTAVPAKATTTEVKGDYQTVNVGHTAFALNPETVTLKAGQSYKLIITPTENGGGCMNTMTFPGLDDNVYPVKAGQAVTVTINNAKAGSYKVVCGAMGMYQGQIIIQ